MNKFVLATGFEPAISFRNFIESEGASGQFAYANMYNLLQMKNGTPICGRSPVFYMGVSSILTYPCITSYLDQLQMFSLEAVVRFVTLIRSSFLLLLFVVNTFFKYAKKLFFRDL